MEKANDKDYGSNETELSHRWRGRAWQTWKTVFIKSNLLITTASGWLSSDWLDDG